MDYSNKYTEQPVSYYQSGETFKMEYGNGKQKDCLLYTAWKDHFPFFGQNGHVPEEIEVHSTRPGDIYQMCIRDRPRKVVFNISFNIEDIFCLV